MLTVISRGKKFMPSQKVIAKIQQFFVKQNVLKNKRVC